MTDRLIQEINEEYRREQLQKFWRSFGSYIVTLSVGIILLTVGIVLWQNHRESTRQEWSEKFLTATDMLDAEKKDEAVVILKEIQEKGLPEQQMIAAILLQQLDEKAVNYDFSARNPYTDYARLYGYAVLKDTPEKANKSYRLAREEVDALALYQLGKTDEAVKKLETLAEDIETPPTMRERLMIVIPYLKEHPIQPQEQTE